MLLAFSAIASADSFSTVLVYGDSLSDNGNLYTAIGYPPSPPYYNGRFSNGPVAVEQLAAQLNMPLIDYAVGGATTGLGNYVDGGSQTQQGAFHLPGMAIEVATPLPPGLAANSLVVVWGGANDFFTGDSALQAASNIDAIVATLEGEGATHILVPGMPDLGLTPEYLGNPFATLYAQTFNSAMQASLPAGAVYVDTFGLLHQIVADPSAYGFTDVTDPCFDKTALTVCSDPSQYLFWDGVHPTTAADAILADQFYAAATPEPSTILMLTTGIAGLAGLLRRRRAA